MWNCEESKILDDVLIFSADIYRDYRGKYIESFNQRFFENYSPIKFVQDDFSTSRKHVLRGLHGDEKTWKLISCAFGEIYGVVLDARKGSKTYGKYESYLLTPETPKFVLVPPGMANGHLVLSDFAVFHYKQSEYYGHQQFSIKYDAEEYSIHWPVESPITSIRDLSE